MSESGVLWVLIEAMCAGVALGSLMFRAGRSCKDAADAAVSDDPPSWWKQELIKARARKDVAAERAKEKQ